MSGSGNTTGSGQRAPQDQQTSPEWDVAVVTGHGGEGALVELRLSKDGRTISHRLEARVATQLSNALIVEAERAQFRAAYGKRD